MEESLVRYALLLDKLVKQGVAFACYFLPHVSEPTLVVESTPVILDKFELLDGYKGVVFAPFTVSKEAPIVVFPTGNIIKGFSAEIDFSQYKGVELESTSYLSTTKEEYNAAFSLFMDQLLAERFAKLVLSRRQVVERNKVSVGSLFLKANTAYPSAFTYLLYAPQCGLWLGATPELLLSGSGVNFQTVALAGTMPVKANEDYLWNEKNREEQQMVADYISEQLAKCGIQKVDIDGPATVTAGSVVHLKSQFFFCGEKDINLGDLICSLHPTPAVCGLPKENSRRLIVDTEPHDRDYYTGFVGVLDTMGETDLYVNLRCMRISQNQLILYAGGGITSKSIGEKEWAETEHKLQTLLSIIP